MLRGRRVRGWMGLVAAVLAASAGFALTTAIGGASADATATIPTVPPSGSLTRLTAAGDCLGYRCARLRGFGPVLEYSYGNGINFSLSSDGRTIVAAGGNPGGIAFLSQNSRTGALTQLPGRRGCISSTRSAGCVWVRNLADADAIVVAGDGRSIAVQQDDYTNWDGLMEDLAHRTTLYSRNPVTGSVQRLYSTKGCVALSNGGPCLRGRGISEPVQTFMLSARLALVAGVDAGDHGRLALWHRTSTRAAWKNAAGKVGCANYSGAAGCLRVPCMDDAPSLVVRSRDGRELYVSGGDDDPEATSEGYLATFQLGGDGRLTRLLGCVGTGYDDQSGFSPTWMQLLPGTDEMLMLQFRSNRGDGIVWNKFFTSTPGGDGALTQPVLASADLSPQIGSEPASDVILSPGGQTLYATDGLDGGQLGVFHVDSSGVTALPGSWGQAYSGFGVSGAMLSPDGRFMYVAVGAAAYPVYGRLPQILVYRVNQ